MMKIFLWTPSRAGCQERRSHWPTTSLHSDLRWRVIDSDYTLSKRVVPRDYYRTVTLMTCALARPSASVDVIAGFEDWDPFISWVTSKPPPKTNRRTFRKKKVSGKA
jgi:hypothetical protein